MKFINDQYEKYLQEEVNINRKKRIPDTRVHCCLYFIPATGHAYVRGGGQGGVVSSLLPPHCVPTPRPPCTLPGRVRQAWQAGRAPCCALSMYLHPPQACFRGGGGDDGVTVPSRDHGGLQAQGTGMAPGRPG